MNKRYKMFTVCLLIIALAIWVSACSKPTIDGIAAQNVDVVYNGAAQSIVVTGTSSGDTITYSTSEEGDYETIKPTFTDVGEYIIFYKVEKEKHQTLSGSATVTITPATIVVTPDALSKNKDESDPILTYTYSGNVEGQTPAFTGALTREAGEDIGSYTISKGTLDLADNGNFKAANYTISLAEVDFVISDKINLTAAVITLTTNAFIYSGAAITPTISSVALNGTTLTSASYTVSYSNNTNVGTGTVTITGKGDYKGTASKNFTIAARTLTITPDARSKIDGEDDPILTYAFSGNVAGETPVFTGALTREAGEDIGSYEILIGTLALADNDDFKAANYTISLAEVEFVISDKINLAAAVITLTKDEFVYTGEAIVPTISSVTLNGTTLTSANYTVSYSNNIYAGTGTVTITGSGNYTGTASKIFTITAKDIADAVITLEYDSVVYDGTAQDPQVTAATIDGLDITYTVAYSNNTNVGTATVTLAANGNFSGTASKNFTISARTLTITPNPMSKTVGTDDPTLTYTFSGNVAGETPAFTGALSREEGEEIGNYKILMGTLALSDNDDFKAANYTISLAEVDFVISDKISLSTAVITLTKDEFVYSGEAIVPTISSVTLNGDAISYANYTVSYSNNINAGTGTVTITGIGEYMSTASKTFTITAKDIADAEITLEYNSVVYDGTAQEPEVTAATIDGLYIAYTVAYSNNTNVGTATVTIIGTGNFNGTASTTFSITAKDIADAEITLEYDSVVYNGTAKEPGVTSATIDGLDIAYTVAYSNNTDVGTATVTITGTGNFSGTASKNFTISARTLTIIPDAQSKTEGEDDPILTYTFSGNVAGEIPAFAGALARMTGELAGSYKVLIGTLELEDNEAFKADNYILALSAEAVYITIDEFVITVENGYAYWWTGDPAVASNISVTTLSGDVVEYSTDKATWYEDQSQITFNSSGAHRVYIKISRGGEQVAIKVAFMVIEEAILLTDFEDGQIPALLTEARNNGTWASGAQMNVVEYNGSNMASYNYGSGMNGILLNLYNNIPDGATHIAVDIYTSASLRYNFQHYVYKTGRSSFDNWYTGSQVTEQIVRTVYISLNKVSSDYPLFSIQMNIASGSGTVYYDNIRFTKSASAPEIPSLDIAPEVITPAHNSVLYEKVITFVWKEEVDAESYNLYLYNDEAMQDMIASYVEITDCSQVVDLTAALTVSQKVYWKMTAISTITGEESSETVGYFNYSDYEYLQFSPIAFEEGGLSGVSWRNNTGGTTIWNPMTAGDLVDLGEGQTAYKTGTTSGTNLFGVRQDFEAGSLSSGLYDTITFTLSTDNPGTYKYRIWIYSASGNYEITPGAGVEIFIGKTATAFYRKIEYLQGGTINKDNAVGYAVQLMGNANPVYFHAMGILDLSYDGTLSGVAAQDFVLDKGAATLNGDLVWDDLDALTGEYYVQLWYRYSGYDIWFIGGNTVYESGFQVIDTDMSDYSAYFSFFNTGVYACNYKIIAKNALSDAGTTIFEGTVNIYLTVA